MDDKPRFEIVVQIGKGQFSNVYKAKWINPPPSTSSGSGSFAFGTQEAPGDLLTGPFQQQELTNSFQSPSLEPSNMMQPLARQTRPRSGIDTRNDLLSTFDPNHNGRDMTTTTTTTNGQYPANWNRASLPTVGSSSPPVKSDKFVALKRIKFYDIQNSKQRVDCIKEVKLLQQLRHPNIIKYHLSFIQKNELYIVLDYADGGDLSMLIKLFQRRKQLLSERTILKYFTQVCSAVEYIHLRRILHRDIKPANIFMTSDGVVKLGDFGLGRFFSQETRDAHSIVGTFYYMSPERIRESGYGFSSDIWSLGCVLYELITLHSPFSIIRLEEFNNAAQNRSPAPLANANFRQPPHHSANNQMKPRQHHNNHFQQPPPAQNQQPQQLHQRNPHDLQYLIDRIINADYPSLTNYAGINPSLRQLATDCLNPNPEARPNMQYICYVVSQAYSNYLQASGKVPSIGPNANTTTTNNRVQNMFSFKN